MSARVVILTTMAAILTAAMMIPVGGSKRAPGKIEQRSQALDLSGEWVVMSSDSKGDYGEEVAIKGEVFIGFWDLHDEGDGKLRISDWTDPGFAFAEHSSTKDPDTILVCGPYTFAPGFGPDLSIRHTFLGIYRQDRDRILMCFGEHGKPRPTSFTTENGQFLISLHRP